MALALIQKSVTAGAAPYAFTLGILNKDTPASPVSDHEICGFVID
jgi:hypothetical protein